MTACSRCHHEPTRRVDDGAGSVPLTPANAPAWLADCPCDCHTAWRMVHAVPFELEPAKGGNQ